MLCSAGQVVRNLPFLKEVPAHIFEAIFAQGRLLKFQCKEEVWAPRLPAKNTARSGAGSATSRAGIFVIISGLVKSSYTLPNGYKEVSFCYCHNQHDWQVLIT